MTNGRHNMGRHNMGQNNVGGTTRGRSDEGVAPYERTGMCKYLLGMINIYI